MPPSMLGNLTLYTHSLCTLRAPSSNGEARPTSTKWSKNSGSRGCQICGSQRGHEGHERVHRIVTGTQRIRVTHSRLGFSQIHASSSIRHQQVRQQASSSTTAETGYPVPAGGSRGPQILSEIPSSPANVPGNGPRVLLLILRSPQNENTESCLD